MPEKRSAKGRIYQGNSLVTRWRVGIPSQLLWTFADRHLGIVENAYPSWALLSEPRERGLLRDV